MTYLKTIQDFTQSTVQQATTYIQKQKLPPLSELNVANLLAKAKTINLDQQLNTIKNINLNTTLKSINMNTVTQHINKEKMNQVAQKVYTNSSTVQQLTTKLNPVMYYGRVLCEIMKQVYVKEKLAPPSMAMLNEAYAVAYSLLSGLRTLSFRSWSYTDIKKGILLSSEAFTFFLLGEIVGRRSLVGKTNSNNSLSTHLIAGGTAGFMEAMACHPLDTIKVRLQLRSVRAGSTEKPLGFIRTGLKIAQREGFFALYKGLGAVVTGIVPKMAIRFSSFNLYKSKLADPTSQKTSMAGTFVAGLGAGVTEAIVVVTPMEVVKIRLQAQRHSLSDPMDIPKYRNPAHAVLTIIREEGFTTLWKGVSLTALRQATNQAANFTTYQELKKRIEVSQQSDLKPYQHLLLGLVSGAMGPICNNPIDTIKTRVQRSTNVPGQSAFSHFKSVVQQMWAVEGVSAFYKGLTPRLLRVAPGNAVTFTVYGSRRALFVFHKAFL